MNIVERMDMAGEVYRQQQASTTYTQDERTSPEVLVTRGCSRETVTRAAGGGWAGGCQGPCASSRV
jgi:hypothetical protein